MYLTFYLWRRAFPKVNKANRPCHSTPLAGYGVAPLYSLLKQHSNRLMTLVFFTSVMPAQCFAFPSFFPTHQAVLNQLRVNQATTSKTGVHAGGCWWSIAPLTEQQSFVSSVTLNDRWLTTPSVTGSVDTYISSLFAPKILVRRLIRVQQSQSDKLQPALNCLHL